MVTQYSFSQDVGAVGAPGFIHPLIEASSALDDAFTFAKYFPGLKTVVDSIASFFPERLIRKVLADTVNLRQYISVSLN